MLISEAFGRLSSMVSEVCSVEEISDYFAINKYSDEALLRPPEIVLTAQEIVDAHELLLSHRTEIAECSANAYHPLDIEFNQLLDDCGPVPEDVRTVLGLGDVPITEEMFTMEVRLVLRKKCIAGFKAASVAQIRIKQALVELIRLRLACTDLNQVLFCKVWEDEAAMSI